ncbi:MAG: hypothetical protein N2487_00205 [Verrucomicrobiae bacterium]|nr:hypothetical protein [Verrucomicrobiae bacterium]
MYLGKIKVFTAGLILFLILVGGCATRPKIDWNARVGNYTFDDAVREMGPPDKSAKLSDGTIVCEWLTSRGYSRGHYVYFPGSLPYYWTDPPAPDRFLRLTFSQEGKLIEWKKYAR